MGLVEIPGLGFPVSASADARVRAEEIARRAAAAHAWSAALLGWRPTLRLTVADETDWPSVAPVPTYGVPQTFGDHTIMAASDAPLFDEFAAALFEHGSPATRTTLIEHFGDPPSLRANFDLFVCHEVVHLFCEQRPGPPAPLWLTELFCNLGMVGYLHDTEPACVPMVAAVADAVRFLVPAGVLGVTALDDMERAVEAGHVNFGWYIESLMHVALVLWPTGGATLYRRLYELLHTGTDRADPIRRDEIVAAEPLLADVIADWPPRP